MDLGLTNLHWSLALFDGLVASGVRHVVISPGSRSTPLVLACTAHARLQVRVLPDERCAAYFALGLAKVERRPVVVVATSGTAPANWYPAVIEASLGRQSLVFISADRPGELHDCGANQTIDQTRLFGVHVRAFLDLPEPVAGESMLRYVRVAGVRAADLSRWPVPGPVHVNAPFREPLVPAGEWAARHDTTGGAPQVSQAALEPDPQVVAALAAQVSGRRGIIVCGASACSSGFAATLSRLAATLDWPLLADPLSGLRCGHHDRSRIFARYDAFLRRSTFVRDHRPERILQFGSVPLSRELQRFIAYTDAEALIVVSPHRAWPDPQQRAARIVHADPERLCAALQRCALRAAPRDWYAAFAAEERRARRLAAVAEDMPVEAGVLERLIRVCPDGATVFVGNSTVVRDVDAFVDGSARAVTLLGNRGASGIDGNVSTVLGLAAGARGPVVGLLGDLALYHDMYGLLAARVLDASLVVFANGGGAIFRYLPQAVLDGFERYWLTPTDLEIGAIARLYGLRHHRVGDAGEFDQVFVRSLETAGVDLVEVTIDPHDSVARHQAYWSAVAAT